MAKSKSHPYMTVVTTTDDRSLVFCSRRWAFTVVKAGYWPPRKHSDNSFLWTKSVSKAYKMLDAEVAKRANTSIENVPVVGALDSTDDACPRFAIGHISYVNGRRHLSHSDLRMYQLRIVPSPAKVAAAVKAVNKAAAQYDRAVKRVYALAPTVASRDALIAASKPQKTK